MKKITFTLLLLTLYLSVYCQVTNYNFTFESTTTRGTWNYFENGSNTQGVSFVNNPNPGGVNSSATVAKFTASADGKEWAGCESIYGTLGKWKFDGANPTTVTVDVYKTTLTPVYIKFTSTNNSGQGTTFIGNKIPSAINQWVTLTFVVDFSVALIGTGNGTGGGGMNNADNNIGNNQIVFHVDKDARKEDRVVYFDNIKFAATKMADPITPPDPIKPPVMRAPEPLIRNAGDVISVYSGKYANLAGTEIKKNWGEATIASDILVENDSVKQLLQFNYQGIVLKNPINISDFEKLHIDFFKTDQAEIKLSIIHVGGSDVTKLIAISDTGWNSFDIPLSDFVGLNRATVHQLKLEGAPKQGSTTVYFDNLYFYKGTGTVGISNSKISNINLYPNPAKSILNVETLSKILNVKIFNIYGQELASLNPETNTTNLNIEYLLPGTYLLRVTSEDKVATTKFIKE
ncbi:MAG: T9SS type A sorting domain-containing protein [Bacteroidia bacterium]|nr:T9SS type A sorting domain-containing protein [Bacteroidia bacterium]